MTQQSEVTVASLTHVDEKRRIALAALDELPTRGTVLFDAGDTTTALAELIPDDNELTIVTNGLSVAQALCAHRKVPVHMIGGRIRGRTMAAVEDWAEYCLNGLRVDVAFLGTNGISAERGLTTPTAVEARIKRKMISVARRKVILADSSKFQVDFFCSFGTLHDIDVVITDSDVDDKRAADVESAVSRLVRV